MSNSDKKLSTFEFLFSWQNKTFLLTENQRTLLRSHLVPLAATFSWLFSATLKLCLDFFSSSKNVQKCKCSRHLAGAWYFSSSVFLNPYDFTKIYILKANCCILWIVTHVAKNTKFSLLCIHMQCLKN